MVNQQVLEGRWNEIQSKIRDRWGQLTDDELQQFQGDVQQLVSLIQRKTGEARDAIESYLEELASRSTSTAKGAADTVRDYARHIADSASEHAAELGASVRKGAKSVSDSTRASYLETERWVRRRPAESMAACFGFGLIVGVVVGLSLRSK